MHFRWTGIVCLLASRMSEALGLWEDEQETDAERTETIQAVREALDDMRAGDSGVPVGEAISDLRRKHNLPDFS
jgi:hypothetical protein